MYRFALRPRWMLGHVVVLGLVFLMVSLGFWQLRRLDEKRAYNARVEGGVTAPVVDLDDALADTASVDDVEFRRVEATGRYDEENEVLVRSRVLDGIPGYHVLTPLVTGDNRAVVINRGWVPLEVGERWPAAEAGAPGGEVTVEGLVRTTEERRGLGPTDPADGRLATLARVDVARMQKQVPYALEPAWLQLQPPPEAGATPADGELPLTLPTPELSEGNHLSYAGQWFIFAGIALIGWVVLVRKSAGSGNSAPRPDDQAGAPSYARSNVFAAEPRGRTSAANDGADHARGQSTASR